MALSATMGIAFAANLFTMDVRVTTPARMRNRRQLQSASCATKSLFCALAGDLAPAELLVRCSRLIRGLKLGRLHMALQVLKVDGTTVRAATAGIPPALLFRAADGTVQELAAGGLPLGTRFDPKYQETEVTLAPGDTVLMATDGFAELATPDGTALGYTGVADVFRQVASMAPPEIVSALLDKADSWSNGAPQKDDITFVVLQARRSQTLGRQ